MKKALQPVLAGMGVKCFTRAEAVREVFQSRESGIMKNILRILPHGLADELLDQGFPLAEFAQFCAVHPAYVEKVFSVLKKVRMLEADRAKVVQLLVRTMADYQLCQDGLSGNAMVLFDGGFTQCCWRMLGFLSGPVSPQRVEDLMSLCPAPAYGVIVRTPLDVIADRMLEKPDDYPQAVMKKGRDGLVAQLQLGENCLVLATGVLRQRGVPIHEITGDRAEIGAVDPLARTLVALSAG